MSLLLIALLVLLGITIGIAFTIYWAMLFVNYCISIVSKKIDLKR
jgi:hypothetical protein